MASTNNGISGIAVAIVAAGSFLIWTGVQNRELLEAFREIVKGEMPTPGAQETTEFQGSGYIPSSGGKSPSGSRVVAIAASYEGHPYVFGGGHGTVCPSGGMDCSGYASCVLNKAGLMKGTLTTSGFANWGVKVPFEQRQPGDIVVWIGGPAGGHMGIIADAETMWHNPCTGCGGVQKSSYGKTRSGRITIVRRAR